MKKIEEYVRSIPDFPEEGIIFRDITSVLQDADGLHLAIDSMQALLDGVDFDVVVGAESRGFVFGTPIAYNLHKPFVLVRKKGKLPCETVSRSYDLEYGTAEIEMHKDSIKPGQRVVLVDDLIATGGTIASKRSEEGLKPLITSEELLGFVPDVKEFCEVTAMQIINIDSTNIQPKHWLLISSTIEKYYDQYDGFVVCHGTDTLAYTASALSYLIQNSPKPIVITGAQKPIDLEITDAKTNLSDSFLFASCDKAHGVNIVFDGKVIAGTRGKKERTKSYNAFSSINFPYIATIQDNHIIFYLDDKEQMQDEVTFYHKLDSKVTLLKLIPSMNGDILDYLFKHYDAIIIESFGVGGIPSYEDDSFHRAIERWVNAGKFVIMTTQVTNEGSNMSVYEIGKTIKKEFGLLEAYDMTLEATVTKLMWILGQTHEPDMVKEMLYSTVNRDILYTTKWKA